MTFEKLLFFFVLTLSYLPVTFGQTKDILIKNIQQSFQKINRDTTLTIVQLQNEDIPGETTDGGQELRGYFKGGQAYKIYDWVGLSFGVKQYEYYFENDQLIFIYEIEKVFPYNESIGTMDLTKLDLNFEGRYYLDKGKLIHSKIKGQKRFNEESTLANVQGLISRSKSLRKLLRSHLK